MSLCVVQLLNISLFYISPCKSSEYATPTVYLYYNYIFEYQN